MSTFSDRLNALIKLAEDRIDGTLRNRRMVQDLERRGCRISEQRFSQLRRGRDGDPGPELQRHIEGYLLELAKLRDVPDDTLITRRHPRYDDLEVTVGLRQVGDGSPEARQAAAEELTMILDHLLNHDRREGEPD